MLVQTVNTIWTKGEMQEDQVELVKKSIDNVIVDPPRNYKDVVAGEVTVSAE